MRAQVVEVASFRGLKPGLAQPKTKRLDIPLCTMSWPNTSLSCDTIRKATSSTCSVSPEEPTQLVFYRRWSTKSGCSRKVTKTWCISPGLLSAIFRPFGETKEDWEQFEYMQNFKETFCRTKVKVHFLGLFDCVNSVGQFEIPLFRKSFKYVSTSPATHIRHAVSINERRLKFKPALF